MDQIEKNTVSAKAQLKSSQYVHFLHPEGTGRRIVFVGNSITRHGVKEDIGWFHDFGMAASAEEKDYVHIVAAGVREKEDAAFCIAQVASWETDFKNGSAHFADFEAVRDFEADVIIMRCIENCQVSEEEMECFKTEYKRLIDYFNPTGKAEVLLTTSFWHHPADKMIEAAATETGYPLIPLGDLGEDDAMKAIGLFEHGGVANHPGDAGMAAIAQRILEKL